MATRDYSEEVLTSGLAYKVLRALNNNPTEACYPTKIAEEIDSSYQSVNNYMKGLRDRGLVEIESTEGKKKFYRINKEKLVDFFFEFWLKKTEKVDFESLQEMFGTEGEGEPLRSYDRESVQSRLKQHRENPLERTFLEYYLKKYLEATNGSTLEKMVYDDFATGTFGYVQELISLVTPFSFDGLFELTTIIYAYEEMEGLEVFSSSLSDFQKEWVNVAGWEGVKDLNASKEFDEREIKELRESLDLS